VEDYAGAVTSALRDGLRGRGIGTEGIALEVEPGRAMYANTGIHLTTVRNVKRQTRPKPHRWVEVDTTEMFLPDGLIERNRWVTIVASRADTGPTQVADVVGISCGFDVITEAADLPEVEPGDVIAFLDTGAYQDAASSNFNALPRPATVLVHGSDAEIVKRAETFEDVFGRDVVPERLREREAGVRVLGLDHVSVSCSDIERSLAFYRDLLGLPVLSVGEVSGDDVERVTGEPGVRMLAADLDLGRGQVLELIEYVEGSPASPGGATAPAVPGHVGLLVDDVDEVHRRLVEAGVRVRSEPVRLSEPGAWFGVRCVNALDPDGVTVELVERPGRPAPMIRRAEPRPSNPGVDRPQVP
jgi:catechol 2,3-dioxygenase-like lactoylglutathione lyase family enzyme